MHEQATKFRGYATAFAVLTAIGSLVFGYAAARETTYCGPYGSCEYDVNGGTYALVAISAFVGGMLLVLPLYAISHVLSGVGRLLDDAGSHEPIAGPQTDQPSVGMGRNPLKPCVDGRHGDCAGVTSSGFACTCGCHLR